VAGFLLILFLGVLSLVPGFMPQAFALSRSAARSVPCSTIGCFEETLSTRPCADQSNGQVLDSAYLQDPDTGYQFGDLELWRSLACPAYWARYTCLQPPSNCPQVQYDVETATGVFVSNDDAGGSTLSLLRPTTSVRASVLLAGIPAFGAQTHWF
jgi:hypothetical protein